MEKIIEYVKNNTQLIVAIAITIGVVILASVLGYFIKKYNWLKFLDKHVAKLKTDKSGNAKKETKQKAETPLAKQEEKPLPPENTHDENEPADDFPDSDQADISSFETQEENTREETEDEQKTHSESKFSKMIRESVATGISEEYEEEKNVHQSVTPQKQDKDADLIETPATEDVKQNYEGTWRILRYGAAYCAELHNNNDELLLKSDNFTAIPDVRKAIKSLQKNIKQNNFNVCVSSGGKFFFKLFSNTGRLIYKSPDFETRQDVLNKIDETKRIAFNAEVVRG